MRVLIAILVDSLREAIDRKSLLVLMGLSLLPILFCFSTSFDSETVEEIVERHAHEVTDFRGSPRRLRTKLQVEVGPVEPVTGDDGWSPEVDGGLSVELRFSDQEALDELAGVWFERQRQRRRGPGGRHGPSAVESDEAEEVGELVDGRPRRLAFVVGRFESLGYDAVEVREDGEQGIEVALRCDEPALLRDANEVQFAFGMVSQRLPGISVAEAVTGLQIMLAQFVVGFVGLLVALISCASFVPNMLQKGTLDLALARPVSRSTLLVGKYLGGLWYVALLAGFLIGGCWLGLVVSSGYASLGFLMSIPSLLLSFAMLHAISTLFGVLTRSTGVAALAAAGVWGLSSVISGARSSLGTPEMQAQIDFPAWATKLLDTLWWLLPKIKEIDTLNTEAIARGAGSLNRLNEMAQGGLVQVEALPVIASALGFVAVMLTLASMAFSSRDY